MDWGETDDWEVDKKAERLNKALFGKPAKGGKNVVKADATLDGTFKGGDSDDDDEKLSKKAKKKLKEKKRRENKRNKKKEFKGENGKDDENKSDGNVEDNEKGMSKENLRQTESKKPAKNKRKQKDKNSLISKETLDKSSNENMKVENEEKTKRNRNRKRKNSDGNSKETKDTEKGIKENDENKVKQSVDNGEEVKSKRRKKKKPNSKKNKYKHLGLKSKTIVLDDSKNDSDSDDGNDLSEMDTKISKSKETLANVDNVKVLPNKGNKRQRSSSPDKTNIKKMKLMNESDKITSPENKTKKTKKQDLSSSVKSKEEIVMENDKQVNGNVPKKSKKDKTSKASLGGSSENNMESTKENGQVDMKIDSKKKKKSKKEKQKSANEIETSVSPFLASGQGSELQQKMTDVLASARFRFINEQLYTIKGGEAFRMFQQDKTLMKAYNTGFQGQVKHWSVNPLDVIIKQIGTKASNLVVADFGCGEARLSASLKQKVHSFDLYPLNKRITVCDMSKTPLASGSVDIAVFCLSLMGTNLSDYLVEANRVLKDGGLLKVAEVVSRFTNVNHFIKAVTGIGFKPLNTRELSTMFYLMDFKKVKTVEKLSKNVAPISLKPCVYKKR